VKLSKEGEEPVKSETVDNVAKGLASWAQTDKDVDSKADSKLQKSAGSDDATASGQSAQSDAPKLDLGEGELLSRGSEASPEKISQLQEMLKGQGLELAVDGKFGPETQNAVREYQRQNGLKVDGIVGPETQGALNGTRAEQPVESANAGAAVDPANPAAPGELGKLSLADPNLSPQEQYEHYKGIIEANGGKINADGPTVLGLRGLGVDGTFHDSAENVGGYNDTFVVLKQGADGKPVVQTFQGATHANQRSSGGSVGTDSSGRSVRGVAQIQPGTYDVDFNSANYGGRWGASYHVKTEDGSGKVPTYRDLNADGVISTTERDKATSGGYTATEILFHNGKGSSPSSIGCQTIIPSQHDAFSRAVGRGGFSYTLVDANNGYMPAG